jgi:hypothetical protein
MGFLVELDGRTKQERKKASWNAPSLAQHAIDHSSYGQSLFLNLRSNQFRTGPCAGHWTVGEIPEGRALATFGEEPCGVWAVPCPQATHATSRESPRDIEMARLPYREMIPD